MAKNDYDHKYFIVGLGQVHIFLMKRITPFSGVFRRFMAFFINFTSFFYP